MQTLEPRRLMSLTAAPDFPPDAEAPAPIVHSFGFENLMPPPPGGGFPFGQTPIVANTAASSTDIETEVSPTDTQTAAVSASAAADNTAVPIPPSVADHSLSAMYAALNTSTVAAIDDADARQSFATTPISPTATAIQNPNLPAVNAPVEIATAEKTGTVHTTPTMAIETIPSPIALSATSFVGPAPAAATGALVPQAYFAHRLETELQIVSALAREMVSQMGRDLAIELAHIEAAADAAVIEQLTAWNGWAAAAAAGAVVLAAAHLQSESKSDEAKAKSVFSSQMIEPAGS